MVVQRHPYRALHQFGQRIRKANDRQDPLKGKFDLEESQRGGKKEV
jgi:hypothetical protein